MKTIFWHAYNTQGSLDFAKLCIENNISFDFMNDFEFYIPIHDNEHFERLKKILGVEIINEKNYL